MFLYLSMEIWNNYKDYRKNKPSYSDWKDERDLQEAKRIAYLKKNGIDPKAQKTDIERAKAVLNAVDVMDEYSQTKAENMEFAVQGLTQTATSVSSIVGGGIACLSLLNKNVMNAVESFLDAKTKNPKLSPHLLVPVALFLAPVVATTIFMSAYSAKQETKASRLGRAEAMKTKLDSVKQFAVLNDEQEKQVNERAKNIDVTDREIKEQNRVNKGLGIINSLKNMRDNDFDNMKNLIEVNKQFEKEEQNVNENQPLTAEQIEEAKKDKQLVQNLVEKIDIASQDYAEDVELATGTLQTVAGASSGALGFLVKFLLSKTKLAASTSNKISAAVGVIALVGIAGWATKIQKNASRVARFKVKQDFLNNPEKLIYVDDEKAKNETAVKVEKQKKKGFFENLKEIVKNNNEYKQYQKQYQKEQIQKSKAREEIEITPEQEKRAKQLQNNVFKMFNKVDEKSQTYSESTEALGESVVGFIGAFAGLPGMFGIIKNVMQIADNTATGKTYIKAVISTALAIIPPVLINILVTKEQKSASKVADMMAIKELDDYRNFADYSKDNQTSKTQNKDNINQSNKTQTTTSANRVVDEILKRRNQNNTQTANLVG